MTYNAQDRSVQDGKPVDLYVIELENLRFFYTDAPADKPMTVPGYGAQVYRSKQLVRSGIATAMSMLDNSNITVKLPIDDAVSKIVNSYVTPSSFFIDIFQYHANDGDNEVKRIFAGFVTNVTSEDPQTTLNVSSLMQIYTAVSMGMITFTPVCNHEFGDARCGVDQGPLAHTTTLSSTWLWTIEVATPPAASFEGGTVINERTGIKRDVVDITGSSILITGAFVDAKPGDTLKFYPSCNHLVGTGNDCFTKYNNVANHGGFPFIPRKNPFVEGFGEVKFVDM